MPDEEDACCGVGGGGGGVHATDGADFAGFGAGGVGTGVPPDSAVVSKEGLAGAAALRFTYSSTNISCIERWPARGDRERAGFADEVAVMVGPYCGLYPFGSPVQTALAVASFPAFVLGSGTGAGGGVHRRLGCGGRSGTDPPINAALGGCGGRGCSALVAVGAGGGGSTRGRCFGGSEDNGRSSCGRFALAGPA